MASIIAKWTALAAALAPVAAQADETMRVEGALSHGGHWVAERPANWNGTLLLWSRGYGARSTIDLAPPQTRELLLARGYALAAANYSRPGWALEEAVPDQVETLDAASKAFGTPKRAIAWGASMGGLISVALAETYPDRFAGALPSCGSIGGALGMMNAALDGAFAFKTLLAPESDIRLVGVDDDMVNSKRVKAVLDAAQQSQQGRARVALAAAIAGLPDWADPKAPRPAPRDYEAQQREAAQSFVIGVYFPRVDQEARAGGNFSTNVGVNYATQLERSGRAPFVRALYRAAGLDLAADLRVLSRAPRIAADSKAVDYMRAHYTPSGRLRIPVLSYHQIGDGQTPVTLQGAYAEMVRRAGRPGMIATAWVNSAGHCSFTPGEHLAAIDALERRLDSGRWQVAPAQLNARAAPVSPARFISYRPAPFLRPCSSQSRSCR